MAVEQEIEFDNFFAAERYVHQSVPELDILPPSETEKFISDSGIITEIAIRPKNAANSRAIIGSFAIRNENLYSLKNSLKIIKAGAKLLIGASGAGSLAGWGTTSASLLELHSLFEAIREKGFQVNEMQLVLLSLIKDEGPIHADNIRQTVPRRIADLDIEMLLSPLVLSDESPNGLLLKEADRWSAVGV